MGDGERKEEGGGSACFELSAGSSHGCLSSQCPRKQLGKQPLLPLWDRRRKAEAAAVILGQPERIRRLHPPGTGSCPGEEGTLGESGNGKSPEIGNFQSHWRSWRAYLEPGIVLHPSH